MAKKTATESILREKTVKQAKVKVRTDSRFKSLRSMSIISVVLVIAICIVANILLSLTLDDTLTFDTSSVQSNTITPLSKTYIKNLDKQVEIIGLFDKNDTSFEWRDYFLPILDDYESKAGGKIDLKYIDPDVDPFIISRLDPDGIYNLQKYTYVIRCGDILVSEDPYSCFKYDTNVYQYYGLLMPITNYIEQIFTGDIVYVTSDRQLHAYFLQGHDLLGHASMDIILKTLGFASSDLILKGETAKIPDDCELLVIMEPTTDLSLTEKELIKSYLDNSGKVLLSINYDKNKNVQYTNLNEVTQKMGITLESGTIHENDINYLYTPDDPYSSIAVADSSYASYISVPATYSVESCRFLRIEPDLPENVYVSPLVVTSSIASVDMADQSVDASASSGTYPIVLQSVDTSKNEPSCLIVISTATFTSDAYYLDNTLENNNAVFMKTMLQDICPIPNSVLVPSKTVPSYILNKPLSSSSATMWSIVVMTVIPLGTLICGVYIYRRRRHL